MEEKLARIETLIGEIQARLLRIETNLDDMKDSIGEIQGERALAKQGITWIIAGLAVAASLGALVSRFL